MRLAIVKLSSLGDIVHAFPALCDLLSHVQATAVTWFCEPAFLPLVESHPLVHQGVPLALRKAKSHPKEWLNIHRQLRAYQFDVAIDAQGLLKSACVTRLLSASRRIGFDKNSAREPASAWYYHQGVFVKKQQHAILRLKQLFAGAFDYPFTQTLNYGLPIQAQTGNRWLLLHGTTWPTKHWPEEHWETLIKGLLNSSECDIDILYGNAVEKKRAERFGALATRVHVHGGLSIPELFPLIQSARAVIGVDTGLLHLAAAMDVPVVGLYGPTDTQLTGVLSKKAFEFSRQRPCAPCLSRRCPIMPLPSEQAPQCMSVITPARVLEHVTSQPVTPARAVTPAKAGVKDFTVP